ncbi:sigma 54-interacting transcriptional regulator [Brevibacillus sp. SYP-B805]|uniref:sigma-54-dependent Fis family transcriptional regulator n=1 Tax=Brevibacillus sp. SYP-B805 TaxID=1578199 RepID=UPI0013EA7878|nr:sigma-54-dependent Fis family transcriptional regulator [Brevibacillus sp. SYP-B805]NGQ93587.1 sigma 54-interacting transcriptional regulator [Brevibacillus sp. SYP-B805]
MMLKDVMSLVQNCLRMSDSLRTAIQYLKQSGFDILPVVDESERLAGVFTRSILYQMLLQDLPLETAIGPYIKQEAVAYPYDTPYEEIKEIVKNSRVGTGVVLDHDRHVLGLVTKADMIMSLFRASQSLQEQLEAVLHSSHLGAFVTDEEEKILFVNQVLCRMLGTDAESLIGRPFRSILPNLDVTPELMKKSCRVAVGQVRAVMRLTRYSTMKGRSGFIGLLQDVSDLEEMAAELEMAKKWQKLLDTTIEHAYDGLVMVNEKGEITFLNQPMAELFSVQKEHAIGKPVTQIFPQLDLMRTLETGVAELSDVLECNGIRYLVQSIPVIQDGVIIGAIGKILFRRLSEVRDVLRRLDVLENQVAYYREQVKHAHAARFTFDQIITADPVMEKIKRTAYKAAKGRSTILLRGESGTGKELFAHAIHNASARKDGPFITVNCAAIPEKLLESEFFGYEPGAFTGAEKRGKIGKFDLANGGTLFLDEIGDMSPNLQAKLLRVLQEREFYRVGGTERIHIDVRIIAATHRSLEQMVERGEFREDLFYRLNVISFEIPPLQQRRCDILPLARMYIKELNQQIGTSITGIDPAAEEILLKYHWPGNVRELRNVMERAMTFAEYGKIQPSDLPDHIRQTVQEGKTGTGKGAREKGNVGRTDESTYQLGQVLEAAEREMILQALHASGGNKSRAAKLLGLSRSVLYEKLAKHRL